MEKYLNMSDCFDVPVYAKKRSCVSTVMMDCNGYEIVNFYHESAAECVAHAINSHDELVAMNNELLAALKSISDVADQERGNAIEMKDMADYAIAKAKGGAA